MSRGSSGRIVIEVAPELKNRLHASVALEGRTLKDWFVEQAEAYLSQGRLRFHGSLSVLTPSDERLGDGGGDEER